MERPIVILCIDRDNDLKEKAKIPGPIIGREKNLEAAMKLGLADAGDADVNALLAAIRLYDKMKSEGKTVEIVTLTGDKKLGYDADKKISNQLEKIIKELSPESAILVSDGAADEEVIPIIKSRIKIDSTEIVIVKQSQALERTYFILLEKLKDPYYAKIIIGIPALLILLFSVSDYLGLGWQPVGIIIGIYLIVRMLRIDEAIVNFMKEFRFSAERISWIGYLGGFALLLITGIVGFQSFKEGAYLSAEKHAAYIIRSVLWPLLVAYFFLVTGKVIDALAEKKAYKVTKYALYSTGIILTIMLLNIGCSWVLNIEAPYISFGDFLIAIISAIMLAYVSSLVVSWIRTDIIRKMKLEGREAIGQDGSLIGKIVGVDIKNEKLIIQTILEKKFNLPFSAISTIEDKVILKTED